LTEVQAIIISLRLQQVYCLTPVVSCCLNQSIVAPVTCYATTNCYASNLSRQESEIRHYKINLPL